LANEIAEYEESGIGVPVRWTYEQHIKGELRERQECQLEVLSLNEPIAPNEFTLNSIDGLKEGTRALLLTKDVPAKKTLLRQVWDGSEIVDIGTMELNKLMKESQSIETQRRRWFIISFNAFAILAIVTSILYRKWKNKQEK